MLFIKSIKFTNLGRHKKVEASISGHVPGLAGPNGRGKTTIIQGVQFAFTGTIDHPDPLRAFIRRAAGPKPPKFMEVEVEFVADGKEGRIIRRVTPTTSSRKLWWDGAEKPVTSEKKVSGILFDILGVDKKAINSTVFIRQGEMDAMFGKDVERRDFYTRLLMLGHMEKISQVVETHRAHIADSIQDLSAVRDQAEHDVTDASDYFEKCVEDLKHQKSFEEDLVVVRGVLRRFEDEVEASRDVELAEGRLKNELGPDAGEPTAWVTRTKRDLQASQDSLDTLAKRRRAHMKAAQAKREADDAHRRAQELTDKFLAMHETEAELAKIGELGENPASKLDAARDLLKKFDDHDELTKEIPAKRGALEEAKAVYLKSEPAVIAKQEDYDDAREDYRTTAADLKMRQEIQKGLEGDNCTLEECGCPVCGSPNPDPDYLTRTIAEGETKLADLKERGSKLQSELLKLKDRWDSAEKEVNRLDAEVEKMIEREANLRMDIMMSDRGGTEKKIETLLEAQRAFAAKEFEHNRLACKLSEQKKHLEPFRLPSQSEITHLEDRVRITTAELSDAPWEDQDDQSEPQIKKTVAALRSSLEATQAAIQELEAAEKKLKQRQGALEEDILKSSADGFWVDFDMPLTLEEVQKTVASYEEQQQAHDEARGRKDAANEALKKANTKLDELDLRMEEQKGRRKLGEDLGLVRDTFKPQGASLEYLNYKFDQIARLAADYLAESGADFMVSASEDIPLAFDFLRTDRSDEVWMPQNRLSGGQKVRLSVATLRAIHALIMPNVGLLVLDEPTTHLDEEAKRSMADMLKRIGDEGTLQILVCDHSPTLIDAFSDVIEVPE